MTDSLSVTIGQYSSKGRKSINQDFHGAYIPKEPLLSSKGIAIAIADGISSSDISQVASQIAVKSFLDDYYCTSQSWSVKTSVQKVLLATNSWLYAQTQRSQYRYNKDKGYVCTFSGIIIKSSTAYLFHVGDARIYRLSGNNLEPLTTEHRTWLGSQEASQDSSQNAHYLNRAIGSNPQLEIDYKTIPLETGDIFIMLTDGVYESIDSNFIIQTLKQSPNDLDNAAKILTQEAFQRGSNDNLTAQIIKIHQLPCKKAEEIYQQLTALPFPPFLKPRQIFDGYEIIRDIYSSSRSHVVLAKDIATHALVAIKTPSVELREDSAYLERFLMEEWIAKRLNNPHVLKAAPQTRKRHYLYIANEFIEGQTLSQWILDNPNPTIEVVRNIIEQIAKGLQSFHRQEMLHQDLRPNNIIIDITGTVKIIDFGSTFVAGLAETDSPLQKNQLLGTAQFMAPEYFLGEYGSIRSDLYSLGIVAYHMLSGKFPYGTQMAKARTKQMQKNIIYHSVLNDKREIPAWIDCTLKKSVHPNPQKRYSEISEFLYDFRHPNPTFLNENRAPLIQSHPLLFWKSLSFILFIIILWLCFIKL